MATTTSVQIDVDVEDGRTASLQRLADQLPAATQNSTPKERMESLLKGLASAGLEEYIEYLTGERHPGTVTQQRELRLCLLMGELFSDVLPSEVLVAEMLGLTPGEARTLVPRVLARYRKRLGKTVEESAKKALKEANGPLTKKNWSILCDPVTYRFLRDRLAGIAGKATGSGDGGERLAPVRPDPETVNGYTAKTETFNALRESLNLPTWDEKAGKWNAG